MELQRAKHDSNSQWREKEEKLLADIERLNVVLRDSNAKNEKLLREKAALENQLKNSEYSLSKETEKVTMLEGKLHNI